MQKYDVEKAGSIIESSLTFILEQRLMMMRELFDAIHCAFIARNIDVQLWPGHGPALQMPVEHDCVALTFRKRDLVIVVTCTGEEQLVELSLQLDTARQRLVGPTGEDAAVFVAEAVAGAVKQLLAHHARTRHELEKIGMA